MADIRVYKVVLLGNGGSGKTTWVTRLTTGEYQPRYIATLGVEVTEYRQSLSDGTTIAFSLYSTSGTDSTATTQGSPSEGYLMGADAVMIFLDGSTSLARQQDSLTRWRDFAHRICPSSPVMLVASKHDLPQHMRLENAYSVSSYTCYGLQTPLSNLTRKLTGNQSIRFVENPPIRPAEVTLESIRVS